MFLKHVSKDLATTTTRASKVLQVVGAPKFLRKYEKTANTLFAVIAFNYVKIALRYDVSCLRFF